MEVLAVAGWRYCPGRETAHGKATLMQTLKAWQGLYRSPSAGMQLLVRRAGAI